MKKLSDKISTIISFISGIIFSNGLGALVQHEYLMAFLSFVAIGVAFMLKRFVDWDVKDVE